MDQEENNVRIITENVLNKSRLFNLIRIRNLIEGVFFAIITIYGLSFIPFKIQAAILFYLFFGGSALLFGVYGINNKSVTEYILLRLRFKSSTKKYHMRSIENVTKATIATDKNGESLTIAQSFFYNAKNQIEEVKESKERVSVNDVKKVFEATFKRD